MNLLTWSLLLVIQHFAFVIVSRARNSRSIRYHAIASLFSNGVWFVSQFILVVQVQKVFTEADWFHALLLGLIYTASTMTGAISSHWFALNYLEDKK